MLQNCSIFNVANVFFDEPLKAHYLKEICEKSSLSPTSVNIYLKQLLNLNLIIKSYEKKGKRNFPLYNSNYNSDNYKKYKRFINVLKLDTSGVIKYISDTIMPQTIVLFGSYSKGEDVEGSDIDIYVQGIKKDLKLSVYERNLKRKLQLLFNLDFNKYSTELKNNIINGIVLNGYLEVSFK